MTVIKLLTILSVGFLICCNEDNKSEHICNTANPINDLEWLNEIVEGAKENSFDKAKIYYCVYDQQDAFIVNICEQCPDAIAIVYDCEGNILCQSGGFLGINTCEDEFSKKELIWEYGD